MNVQELYARQLLSGLPREPVQQAITPLVRPQGPLLSPGATLAAALTSGLDGLNQVLDQRAARRQRREDQAAVFQQIQDLQAQSQRQDQEILAGMPSRRAAAPVAMPAAEPVAGAQPAAGAEAPAMPAAPAMAPPRPEQPSAPRDEAAAIMADIDYLTPLAARSPAAAAALQVAQQRLARFEQSQLRQQDRAFQMQLAAANRPRPAPEPLVPVEGPDGRSVYVPRGQAVGRPVPQQGQRPGTQEERDDALLFNPASDPNSPEYRAAFFRRTQPRAQMVTDPDTGTQRLALVAPELPAWVRRPPEMPAAGAQAPQAPPAPPPAGGMPPLPQQPPTAPGAPPAPITQGGGLTVQPVGQAPRRAAPTNYEWDESGARARPIPGGPADPTTQPLTEAEAKANLFGSQMAMAQDILAGVRLPSTAAQIAWRNAPEAAVNMALNENDQQYFNAIRLFAAGVLRKETGAAFTAQELLDVQSRFFPMPGDSPAVIEQKRRAREQAIASIQAEVRGGLRGVTTGRPSATTSTGEVASPPSGALPPGVTIRRLD